MSGGRVLFWVQHLLGVGHLRRAELICDALVAADREVTIALGAPAPAGLSFAGARVVELPAARIAGDDFSTVLDEHYRPVDERWRARRRDVLLSLLDVTAPAIVLLEMYPFGRRQFAFELLPLLEASRRMSPRPTIVSSLRDVLVAKPDAATRDHKVAELVRRHVDLVLVHGDPSLIPLDATFGAVDAIAERVRYTGYVAPTVDAMHDGGCRQAAEVVVSAGGGAVGEALLLAAAAARPLTRLADARWRFMTGPNISDDAFERVRGAAGAGATVERFRSDFRELLQTCAMSVSQAGYNTVMDVLAAAAPAVVVPYEAPGETEQRLRADLLARRGLLSVVPAKALHARSLADAINARLAEPPRHAHLELAGAAETARILAAPVRRAAA